MCTIVIAKIYTPAQIKRGLCKVKRSEWRYALVQTAPNIIELCEVFYFGPRPKNKYWTVTAKDGKKCRVPTPWGYAYGSAGGMVVDKKEYMSGKYETEAGFYKNHTSIVMDIFKSKKK